MFNVLYMDMMIVASSDDYEVYDYDWVYSFMDDDGVNNEQENEEDDGLNKEQENENEEDDEEPPKAYAASASKSGNKSTVQSSSGDKEKFDPFKDDAVNEDDMASTIAIAQEQEDEEAASTGPQMKKAVTGGKHSKMDTSGKRGGGTGSNKFEAAPANSEEGSGQKIPNPPTVQPAVSSGNTKLKRSLGSKEKVSYDAGDQKMLNQKKHKGCLMHDEEEPCKADPASKSGEKSHDDQT